MKTIEKISNGIEGKKITIFSKTEDITLKDASSVTGVLHPNLKAWLKFDGDLTDETGLQTWVNGTYAPTFDTTNKVLGSASLGMGIHASIETQNNLNWEFGSDDFVIKCRFRNTQSSFNIMTVFVNVSAYWRLAFIEDYLVFRKYPSGEGFYYNKNYIGNSALFKDDAFHTLTLARSGDTCNMWVDGINIEPLTVSTAFPASIPNLVGKLTIGQSNNAEEFDNIYAPKNIDEVMIYVGTDLGLSGGTIVEKGENSGYLANRIKTPDGNDFVIPANRYVDLLHNGENWITSV